MRRFGAPEDDTAPPTEVLDGLFRHGVMSGRLGDDRAQPTHFMHRPGAAAADGTLPEHALDGLVRHGRPTSPGRSQPPRRLGDAPNLREAYRQMNSMRLAVAATRPEPMEWYDMLSERERRMVLERALVCEPFRPMGNSNEKQSRGESTSTSTAATTTVDQPSDSSRSEPQSSDSTEKVEASPADTHDERSTQDSLRDTNPHEDNFDNEVPVNEKSKTETETDLYDTICAVCLGSIEKGQIVNCPVKCPHVFHRDCLLPWLVKHGDCPYCRIALVDEHDWGRGAMRLSIQGGVGGLGSMLSDSVRFASDQVLGDLVEEEEPWMTSSSGTGEEMNDTDTDSRRSEDDDLVEIDLGSVNESHEHGSDVDLESTQHGEWNGITESGGLANGGGLTTAATTMVFGELSDTDQDDSDEIYADMVDIELGPG